MKFKTVAKIGGAVAAVMMVEPTSLLGKGACVLVGGALGAVIADPLQKEIAALRMKTTALGVMIDEKAASMTPSQASSG